jgi:hypothetical protein
MLKYLTDDQGVKDSLVISEVHLDDITNDNLAEMYGCQLGGGGIEFNPDALAGFAGSEGQGSCAARAAAELKDEAMIIRR